MSDNDPMEYSDHHSLPDDDPVDEFINAARQYRTIEIDDSDGELYKYFLALKTELLTLFIR